MNTDCSLGSNPSQPPLIRGGASFALPLIRGSWRGFGSNNGFVSFPRFAWERSFNRSAMMQLCGTECHKRRSHAERENDKPADEATA